MIQKIKQTLWPIYGPPLRWLRTKKSQHLFGKSLDGGEVYFIGTPEHSNLGDSAIALAELNFLEKCGVDRAKIREITTREYEENRTIIKDRIPDNNLICFIGGGNMGNQWMNEELLRRMILEDFPENPKVLFPQTVYYTPTPEGAEEESRSIPYYNAPGFALVAREKTSYNKMRALYPEAETLLTPDIVLSATTETFGAQAHPRSGVLLCMRRDAEKQLSAEQERQIKAELEQHGLSYTVTDMHTSQQITKENRRGCVRAKMEEFLSASLVITDRLHGMIFAALTGTPCIAFSNYNHKVSGTYEWIHYLPYVKYVESVDELRQVLPLLLELKDCTYDNAPLFPYFDKLAEVVKEKCH